ncbi:MAG TPA: hypothetical protein VLC09_20845 [Polyangiaceae bacterium]|nr:hypothetical protein [Polyangiaceae bacterium]
MKLSLFPSSVPTGLALSLLGCSSVLETPTAAPAAPAAPTPAAPVAASTAAPAAGRTSQEPTPLPPDCLSPFEESSFDGNPEEVPVDFQGALSAAQDHGDHLLHSYSCTKLPLPEPVFSCRATTENEGFTVFRRGPTGKVSSTKGVAVARCIEGVIDPVLVLEETKYEGARAQLFTLRGTTWERLGEEQEFGATEYWLSDTQPAIAGDRYHYGPSATCERPDTEGLALASRYNPTLRRFELTESADTLRERLFRLGQDLRTSPDAPECNAGTIEHGLAIAHLLRLSDAETRLALPQADPAAFPVHLRRRLDEARRAQADPPLEPPFLEALKEALDLFEISSPAPFPPRGVTGSSCVAYPTGVGPRLDTALGRAVLGHGWTKLYFAEGTGALLVSPGRHGSQLLAFDADGTQSLQEDLQGIPEFTCLAPGKLEWVTFQTPGSPAAFHNEGGVWKAIAGVKVDWDLWDRNGDGAADPFLEMLRFSYATNTCRALRRRESCRDEDGWCGLSTEEMLAACEEVQVGPHQAAATLLSSWDGSKLSWQNPALLADHEEAYAKARDELEQLNSQPSRTLMVEEYGEQCQLRAQLIILGRALRKRQQEWLGLADTWGRAKRPSSRLSESFDDHVVHWTVVPWSTIREKALRVPLEVPASPAEPKRP